MGMWVGNTGWECAWWLSDVRAGGGSSEPEMGEPGVFGHPLICGDRKITEVLSF